MSEDRVALPIPEYYGIMIDSTVAQISPAVFVEEETKPTAKSRPGFRSPLRYPGGKQKAIDQIAKYLPAKAREFREPLVGGGSVFFHARSISFAEKYWINDAFKELMSFWQIVQDAESCQRLAQDLERFRSGFSSADEIREFFLTARNEVPEHSFREAFLFFFFNRVTFSGTTRAGGFSRAASLTRFTASSIERLLPMPAALKEARITCSDFEESILEPGEDVFIFLDPPYFTATKLYGHNGSLHAFDHWKLAKLLQQSSHKFLITYDDCQEIRDLYKWANIKDWQLQYGMNNCNLKKQSKIGNELFISNY
ncbi:DNA adenine methylase [soil metagenome]